MPIIRTYSAGIPKTLSLNLLAGLQIHWTWIHGLDHSRTITFWKGHGGSSTPRSAALEYFLAVCGALTLEGGPIFWVATHRIHHQKSDQPAIRTHRGMAAGGLT